MDKAAVADRCGLFLRISVLSVARATIDNTKCGSSQNCLREVLIQLG